MSKLNHSSKGLQLVMLLRIMFLHSVVVYPCSGIDTKMPHDGIEYAFADFAPVIPEHDQPF